MRAWEQEKSLFFSILVFTSSWNFMLNWAEHEKSFITSGQDHINISVFIAIVQVTSAMRPVALVNYTPVDTDGTFQCPVHSLLFDSYTERGKHYCLFYSCQ